jgi:hypothetical protein
MNTEVVVCVSVCKHVAQYMCTCLWWFVVTSAALCAYYYMCSLQSFAEYKRCWAKAIKVCKHAVLQSTAAAGTV